MKSYNPTRFDALEISGLKTVGHVNGKDVVETCEASEAEFFGVYGHLPEGGVDHIEDFPNIQAAEGFASRLGSQYPNLGTPNQEKCPTCGYSASRKPDESWVLLDGGKRVCTNPWHNPNSLSRRS